MSRPDNIRDVGSLDIDYMGFIFYPHSPRYCGDILQKTAVDSLPKHIVPVAVTVNMQEYEIFSLAEQYGFTVFQLHGDETPETCRNLRKRGFTVIKALGIRSADDIERAAAYSGDVDYFLFDTATAARGGSGMRFDWKMLAGYSLPEKFFLSGGIAAEAADEIAAFRHDAFVGVDLNSRFETAPGIKDVKVLTDFIKILRGL